MKQEISRQLVHLSGLFFVILAQFIEKELAVLYFTLIAITFLIYSEYLRREYMRIRGVVGLLEKAVKDVTTYLERKDAPRPFFGAFWFYVGLAVTFFIFPLHIASAASASLAVGDALATMFGKRFGKFKILGNKTFEGTLIFFISAFTVSAFFIEPALAFICAVVAALVELAPELRFIKKTSLKAVLDDNLIVPIIAALAVYMLF